MVFSRFKAQSAKEASFFGTLAYVAFFFTARCIEIQRIKSENGRLLDRMIAIDAKSVCYLSLNHGTEIVSPLAPQVGDFLAHA